MMSQPLVIYRRGAGRQSTIGDIPGLSLITTDVEASARAALYQQLADFQAIPQRINTVVTQLNAFAIAAPTRSADDSAALTALQAGVSALQAQWSSTNASVASAITAISSGGALAAAGSVASAVAGMTLASQGIDVLEQQARSLVQNASGLSDDQRASILAMGAPYSIDLVTILKYGVGAFVLYKVVQLLFD
jgi:hypothetical protein